MKQKLGILIVVLGILTSCGGGTMGTGLSYGSGTKGAQLSRLTVIDLVGAVVDVHGTALPGMDVTIKTPHGERKVQTDQIGSFTSSATYAEGEAVSFSVEGGGISGSFIDADPPLEVSSGKIILKVLSHDFVRSDGIQ